MRICLIARNRFHSDRKAGAVYRALATAGHEVAVVAIDNQPPSPPVRATVPRRARPAGRLGSLLSKILPSAAHDQLLRRRLANASAELGADLFVPLHEDVLDVAMRAARQTGGAVQRDPQMNDAGDVDLIRLAPSRPELSMPTSGHGDPFVPGDYSEPPAPEPGRYPGEKAVVCYRKTEANPGRYLEAALVRSGLDVRVETDAIDLSTVDPTTSFVLFVESPYPAIDVTGSTPVPVLFWAHHGEHHLYPNLRLAERYAADAVLLAHSWHLAHWFPVPVHRFPFAVAPELCSPSKPLEMRRYDVAMVGSKLRERAWQYRRRRQLVEELESQLDGDRVCFAEGVTPGEMADIYGDSRIVLNEGGVRHYPITMRVFEAVGCGAALLTDPVPGLEMLFEPETHYAQLGEDVARDVARLVEDSGGTQAMVDSALDHAMGRHTYDHRTDQLMEIVSGVEKRETKPARTTTELGRLVDRDVEVQRLVHDSADDLADQLPNREIWPVSEREGRLAAGSMDAAVIMSGNADEKTELLDAARRYIYAGEEASGLEDYLSERQPDARMEIRGTIRRVDLMAESYREDPAETAT